MADGYINKSDKGVYPGAALVVTIICLVNILIMFTLQKPKYLRICQILNGFVILIMVVLFFREMHYTTFWDALRLDKGRNSTNAMLYCMIMCILEIAYMSFIIFAHKVYRQEERMKYFREKRQQRQVQFLDNDGRPKKRGMNVPKKRRDSGSDSEDDLSYDSLDDLSSMSTLGSSNSS